MKIRKKSKAEIKEDIAGVKKNIEMNVIKADLHGMLKKKTYPKYLKASKKLERQREVYEKEGTLILRVCQNKADHTNIDSGRKTTTSNTVIEFGDYIQHLHLHEKLHSGSIKNLKILIQHDNGNYELEIPDADRTNMLKYLIDGKPPIEFDCQSFIHKAKGMRMRGHGENFSIIADKWIFGEKKPHELHPGDCVCTFKHFSNNRQSYNKVQHFAYCIGGGLFISKFGTTGSLCVSNLQEMHDFYGTREFVSMVPNPKHEDSNIHTVHS